MGGTHENNRRNLRVLVRETRCADGIAARELKVFCPRRRRCIGVQECTTCQFCDGFSLDPSGRHSLLICGWEDVAHAARMETTPPSLPNTTPVSEIMTRNVLCVTRDLNTDELRRIFLERGISGAPVVDGQGQAIGVVSKTDLVRHTQEAPEVQEDEPLRVRGQDGTAYDLGPGFHSEPVSRVKVQDIMTPIAYTLKAGTSIAQAAALMAFEGVHRLPIVCETNNEIIGLLSALDVMRWIGEQNGYLRSNVTG